MTKTSTRCDRILALIDACLADVEGPITSAAGSGTSCSPVAHSIRPTPSPLSSLV